MDKDEVRDWILPEDYDHVASEAKHLLAESDADKVLFFFLFSPFLTGSRCDGITFLFLCNACVVGTSIRQCSLQGMS